MKIYLRFLVAAILVFAAIPAIAVAISPDELGMAVGITLLMFGNPLFFLLVGFMAPCKSKLEVLLPIVFVIIFFVSTKLIYGMDELFYVYIYLAISYVAMAIRYLILRYKRRKAEEKKMQIQDL